eukprot:4522575-Pleurochrysis_carterae.AAC.7
MPACRRSTTTRSLESSPSIQKVRTTKLIFLASTCTTRPARSAHALTTHVKAERSSSAVICRSRRCLSYSVILASTPALAAIVEFASSMKPV